MDIGVPSVKDSLFFRCLFMDGAYSFMATV